MAALWGLMLTLILHLSDMLQYFIVIELLQSEPQVCPLKVVQANFGSTQTHQHSARFFLR